jgi:PAS domain S-box-containing protein
VETEINRPPAASRSSVHIDFRTLAENASSGMWFVDAEWRTIFANRALAEMLRTTPEAMLGRPLIDFVDPEERALADYYVQRRRAGVTEMHEFKFRRSDGTSVWTMVSTSAGPSAAGEPPYFAALVIDITKLKESRVTAAIVGENFERLLSYSPYPLLAANAAGVILRVNRMFERTFHVLAHEVIGRRLDTVVNPVGTSWTDALQHGETASYMVRVAFEDGSGHDLQAIVLPLLADGAGPASIHCFVEAHGTSALEFDLMAQRDELEQRVREKTQAIELQARAMEATMEGMAILEGDRYLWMNEAHSGMYGWEPAPLIGKTWRELYSEPVQRWIETTVFPVLGRDGRWQGEIVGRKKDGSPVDIELSLTLAPSNLLVCCCRDITARKAGERRLAESMRALDELNARLQKANKMKDEFLACMSHELRTPLHSVIGIAELLSEGIAGPTTDRQRQYLEQLLSSGRHLLGLISDLLDVSKIEGGQLSLVREPVALQYLLDVSVEMIARPAAEAGLILARPTVDPSLTVDVDERRIVQVIVNLLSNAVKFTPRGGRVSVDVQEGPASVSIAVSDTGIGIAPEDQAQLFQAFRQLDSSLTRKEGGTGLGLYLVKRITELHGGLVSVESTPGAGSVFRVALPRTSEAPLTPAGSVIQ